jgi:hypothetical protein
MQMHAMSVMLVYASAQSSPHFVSVARVCHDIWGMFVVRFRLVATICAPPAPVDGRPGGKGEAPRSRAKSL